jgi:tRNA(Ile)-lysidine synthase
MRGLSANDPVSEMEAAALFAALSESPAVVLAVSGGPDSTALLWLAARWRDGQKSPPRLIAVTVDHGLRRESAREARAVKRLARTLEVEHRTLRWTGRKPQSAIQEAARAARYRLLGAAARAARARYVVTAHTLDDQAETVLFRLLRGSGVAGLRGMTPVAALPGTTRRSELRLLRPLLTIPKSRLLATLAAADVAFADDPSNRDPRFARPRLRALMPQLAAEGLTAQRLAVLSRRIGRAEIALDDALNKALMRFVPGPWPEKGPVAVEVPAFAGLAEEIALRLLGRLIEWTGNEGPVELGKLEALCASLESPVYDALLEPGASGRFRRTLAGALITVSGGKLTVERAPSRRTGGGKPASGRQRVFTKLR